MLEPMFRAGETFPQDPAISEGEAHRVWVEQSQAVMAAVDGAGSLLGTYYVRPNPFSLGAHVANAGLRCSQRIGVQMVGTLPGDFHYRQFGDGNPHVMFQLLLVEPGGDERGGAGAFGHCSSWW